MGEHNPFQAVPARRRADDTFPARFEAALDDQSRTLSWLRDRLATRGIRVALSTLSYWRSGHRQPEHASSIEALRSIEEMLDLSPGHLTESLGPPRRPGPPAVEAPATEVFGGHPALAAALEVLDLADWATYFTERTLHVAVDVDEHGNDRRLTIRALMSARRDGAQRLPLVIAADGPVSGEARFNAVAGCRNGQTLAWREHGLFAAELVLDRPLRVGETCALEYEVLLPDDAHSYYEHHVVRPIRELMVWVRFQPSRVPLKGLLYTEAAGRRHEVRVDLNGTMNLHHAVQGFGPGTIGISWEW